MAWINDVCIVVLLTRHNTIITTCQIENFNKDMMLTTEELNNQKHGRREGQLSQ